MTPVSPLPFHSGHYKGPTSDINLKLPWFFKVSYSLTEPKRLVASKSNSFMLQMGSEKLLQIYQRKKGSFVPIVRSKQKFGKGRKVTHSPDTTLWVHGRDSSAEPAWQAHREVPTATDRTGRAAGLPQSTIPGPSWSAPRITFAFCCLHLPVSCVRRYARFLSCPFVQQKQKLTKVKARNCREAGAWEAGQRNFQGLAAYANKVQWRAMCVRACMCTFQFLGYEYLLFCGWLKHVSKLQRPGNHARLLVCT